MASNLTNWAFTTLETSFQCRNIGYSCLPPSDACAFDVQTARTFCCGHGGVCWNDIATCASDGSTFTCQGPSYTWCCVTGREQCDQSRENACLSSVRNLLSDLTESVLEDTYSSLSAAQPSASYLSFDPVGLVAALQTSSSPTSASTTDFIGTYTVASETTDVSSPETSSIAVPEISSLATFIPSDTITSSDSTARSSPPATTSPSSESTTATPSETSNSSDLSGGAIAGIVVGAVAGVALLALFIWYVMKRRTKPAPQTPSHVESTWQPGQVYAPPHAELHGASRVAELKGSTTGQGHLPHELQ